MLATYARLARWLKPFEWLAWLLTVGAVIGFAYTVLLHDGGKHEAYGLAAVCVGLWSMCLIVFVRLFSMPVPVVDAADGWVTRAGKSFKRSLMWLAALAATVMSVVLVAFSLRAFTIMV